MINKLDYYYTLKENATAEFKDRGSKFIAYIQKLSEESQFTDMLEELKAKHHKANHHCYAFRIKSSDMNSEGLSRSSDDGEPSGTAGKPILNQLISAELEDVACVVVRYFGGTKLGTSGLIQAYKGSATLAIEHADRIKAYYYMSLKIHFDYSIMGQLMDAVKSLDYEIAENSFDSNPWIIIQFRRSETHLAEKKIKAVLLNRKTEDIEEDTELEGLRFGELQSME